MTFEDTIRQIIQEENEKHLDNIKRLLESHGYHEAPRFLTVPEAAEILRIGKTATYELCRQSENNGFPAIREGHKIRIPYTALMNWIDQQTNQKAI
ncbi:helix-turn-helix domain-containing protein [Ornithinibacillus sp. L9]|uniref:Helix-turn-helix domain-containing protein n=1 Tax=Ornithinibacillus caprae TaxID=2678566 RepID=A0A6N8FHQ6_9BACI|nr:helix-turn-helix domain-containing protein [Ornithinibacillus caprae]MUK89120.1 helix-turn-helix domain-containing protein [Ornithinibacillus caprae]